MQRTLAGCAARRVGAETLEGLREFFGEGTLGRIRSLCVLLTATTAIIAGRSRGCWARSMRRRCRHRRFGNTLRPRRLRRIGAQQAVFERGAVEAANDGVHLLFIRSFNKSEPFGFLGLRVADNLHGIGHQVFRVEPRLDVVGCYPGRKVTEKYGGTHRTEIVTPLEIWRCRGGSRPCGIFSVAYA